MEALATQEEDWSQCTKEQVLTKLEALSRKKLVTYARTRFHIIPSPMQEVKTPRPVLLGAFTVRGSGVTKATFGNTLLTGIHYLASISEELK
eukprot:3532549-Prorocentrum_lima.AAC.1